MKSIVWTIAAAVATAQASWQQASRLGHSPTGRHHGRTASQTSEPLEGKVLDRRTQRGQLNSHGVVAGTARRLLPTPILRAARSRNVSCHTLFWELRLD